MSHALKQLRSAAVDTLVDSGFRDDSARRAAYLADDAIRGLSRDPAPPMAFSARERAVNERFVDTLVRRCEDCGAAGTPTDVERVDHDEDRNEVRVPVRAFECQCGNLWEVAK
jgi:hypothetical protein